MDKKTIFLFLVPVIVAIVFIILNIFPFYQMMETKLFDLLLHVKPAIKADPSILFLDVDDASIDKVGLWPWSRDIMADGLVLMKEFDAGYALFDIEYLNPSPQGVNGVYLNEEIPGLFENEFGEINSQMKELFKAIRTGQLTIAAASEYINELESLNNASKEKLLGYVQKIARDNDQYLGQAARFFNKAFFTVNLPTEDQATESSFIVDPVLKKYVEENLAIKNISVKNPSPHAAAIAKPAILPVLSNGAGAGFPNVIIDDDGVFRRIDLLMKYGDRFYPQLIFAPLLDKLGNPGIEFYSNKIILKGAQITENTKQDIVIPLAADGRMLINWLKDDFNESFRHISYYKLVEHKNLEQNLVYNLFRVMKPAGYLSYYKGEDDLEKLYLYAEGIRIEMLESTLADTSPAGASTTVDNSRMAEYREIRDYFFSEIGSYLHGSAEKSMLDELDAVLARDTLSAEERTRYKGIRDEVAGIFAAVRRNYDQLADIRREFKLQLPGAFCILGWTGISTTDIGVTAFSQEYMNVGVHASIMNTIVNRNFLDILPWWISAIIALGIAIIVTIAIRNLKPLHSILVGTGFVLGIFILNSLFFAITGMYLNVLTPALVCFFTFLIRTFIVFMQTEKEKTFIRGAFSHYLSSDVVNELISSPEKLNLGGEKKYMTALFTDIKGFSTISEALDPSDLVKLLNMYLTEMSNIILSQKGTIDKYEGDAIISFFGAPIALEDHAKRACAAAARMKKMENLLNEHFIMEKLSPAPMYTRIGINTGEMVVGNMGTNQKMDYTIMGNAVNLAARLEGVNKQYGSWILVSEQTYKDGCENLVTRMLDRVRVVGIKTAVRLYEILDEKEFAKPQIVEAVAVFHDALAKFENKDWTAALAGFERVKQIIPEDGPAEVYIKRCREYLATPPKDNWDGVFNLTMK